MENDKLPTRQIILLYACYFLLGFALLSLEVIWGRLTSLTLGSSIHAYSVTLAAVMAGLFFGTLHGNRMSVSAGASRLFTYMAGFALFSALASICFVQLPEFFGFWRFSLPFPARTAYYVTLSQVSLLVFLPSLFAGAVFPIATQLLVPDKAHAGRTAGFLYMMNSMGAIAGSLLTGFVLIEYLGLKNSAILCSALPALPAALFFLAYRPAAQSITLLSMLTVLLTSAALMPYPAFPFTVYSANRIHDSDDLERSRTGFRTIAEYENRHGIVRVVESGKDRFLQVNNKNESSFMGLDLPTQALLALLPRVYLQREPQRLLDIGLGTGTTVWIASQWAGEIDSIEINPDVHAAATRFFFPELEHASNINFILKEARFYLAGTEKKYDILTVEPSYPTDAVTASLYTVESFRLYHDALTDDGVLGMFIPLHVLGIKYAEGVIKTMMTSFAHVQAWNMAGNADIVVVAGKKPLGLSPDEVHAEVAKYKMAPNIDLSAAMRYAQRNATLSLISQSPDVPLYTDDTITLELAALEGFLHGH